MKRYTDYKIEIAFEQYTDCHEVLYMAMAEGIEQAKKLALEKFWATHSEEHNLRIHHITITEYN